MAVGPTAQVEKFGFDNSKPATPRNLTIVANQTGGFGQRERNRGEIYAVRDLPAAVGFPLKSELDSETHNARIGRIGHGRPLVVSDKTTFHRLGKNLTLNPGALVGHPDESVDQGQGSFNRDKFVVVRNEPYQGWSGAGRRTRTDHERTSAATGEGTEQIRRCRRGLRCSSASAPHHGTGVLCSGVYVEP
jgi:hypothetical protein